MSHRLVLRTDWQFNKKVLADIQTLEGLDVANLVWQLSDLIAACILQQNSNFYFTEYSDKKLSKISAGGPGPWVSEFMLSHRCASHGIKIAFRNRIWFGLEGKVQLGWLFPTISFWIVQVSVNPCIQSIPDTACWTCMTGASRPWPILCALYYIKMSKSVEIEGIYSL